MKELIYDVAEKLSNGNTVYYTIKDGTYFEKGILLKDGTLEVYSKVDERLMDIINNYRSNDWRVRIWCGDIETGRAWNEEYAVTGTIGRSNGSIKIPLIIANKRSYGGLALNVGNIIRIDDIEDKRTIWKMDNFHVEKMEIELVNGSEYPFAVIQHKDDGTTQNIANFKKENQARNYIAFLEGRRYRK